MTIKVRDGVFRNCCVQYVISYAPFRQGEIKDQHAIIREYNIAIIIRDSGV